jgi:transcription termination factor Rho
MATKKTTSTRSVTTGKARSKTAAAEVTVDDLVGAPPSEAAASEADQPQTPAKTQEETAAPVEEQEAGSDATEEAVSMENPTETAQGEHGRKIHIGGNGESYRPQYNNNNRFNRFSAQGGRYGAPQDRDGGQTGSSRPSSQRSGFVPEAGPTETVVGFLDIQPEGHGFLRPKFIPSSRDIYISQSQIRRFLLRGGDQVEGVARPPKDTERYYGLLKVEKVNGVVAEDSMKRAHFDDLTPIYPNKQVLLSTGKTPLSTRVIDLVAPIGFGQRGMIVSPPKAGKTTILKEIAAGISANFPDVHLMAALIGERPEEVTDISMSVKGEVIASNFDEPPENQTRVAEITLERAKRMVEMGKDVIILLDSITRLARAYNLVVDPSGRTLSGGFDPAALWPAKKFFGAARNCQEGGSLTIIGTALVETGSRMDDLIYEEFKGTGNMELHLVRSLAERRIFPAISIERSGTRGEEKILSEDAYKKIVTMRRMMDMLDGNERTAILVERLGKVETNDEFLETLGKS